MATNPHFNFFNHTGEQDLVEDLIVECIRQFGVDLSYLPRTGVSEDDLLTEYQYAEFNQALPVEMYVKNFDSFEGEGQLLSKFGLEIRDQMTLILSRRSFKQFIQPYTEKERPLEGDVLIIPFLDNNAYQIKYVNSSAIFYTMGKLQTYEIVCELFEYSNEKFATGVPEIDSRYPQYESAIDNPEYNLERYDNSAGNKTIQEEGDDVLDLSEFDPFGGENI